MTEQAEPLVHEFVTPQKRGVLALPSRLRERLHLDEPGAQAEFIERPDGVFEVRGVVPVPGDQRWFWTERWQAMEADADADVAAGRTVGADGPEEFLAELDG